MRKWARHEDALFVRLWNDDKPTIEQIAETFERTPLAISKRASFMRTLKDDAGQFKFFLRDRNHHPRKTSGLQATRAKNLELKLAPRKCTLCDRMWRPETRYQRFCATCRKNERMSNI